MKKLLIVSPLHVSPLQGLHQKLCRSQVAGDGDVVKITELDHLEQIRLRGFWVVGILEKNDYQGYMLVEAEQDPAKANPFEYALKARNYIRQTAGI